MRKFLAGTCLITFFMQWGISSADPLAPRKGMAPVDRAKVHSVLSKSWVPRKEVRQTRNTEEAQTTNNQKNNDINTQYLSSGIGSKTCVTNVGTINSNSNGLSSGQYGPSNNKDNVIAINGDIISVCK